MTFCENLLMMTTYVLVLSPQSFSSSIAAFRPCRDLGCLSKGAVAQAEEGATSGKSHVHRGS